MSNERHPKPRLVDPRPTPVDPKEDITEQVLLTLRDLKRDQARILDVLSEVLKRLTKLEAK